MSDKELLELAAKAAGYELEETVVGGEPKFYLAGELLQWNPLTDDGDALRLAVARNMTIYLGATNAYADSNCGMSHESFANGDKAAALRRAIVRSAAEDGKYIS